ncbi:hypothetical protein M5K25_001778 [Dendrobium thyrsiflorum]|uniref:Protein transport protein sec16 n=1 Tax=Dendrobium thyrsiflorum TaxID=117978 RepID=A0ABD0VSP3_DENTH
MASFSPQLQADQTDEEFFSKLVESDYKACQSHSEEEDMVRALSNFSLGEVEDSGSASDVNGQKDNQSLSFSEATKNDASIVDQSEGLTEGAAIGARGASFKEIQWSAFSVNSQQFGLGDFESDLFLGSGFGSFVNSKEFSESKSTLIENTTENLSWHVDSYEQQYARVYRSISEQSAGLTEMKNWENLYPGRKYETITGLCYQLDDNNATAPSQSDNFITTSANSHETSEVKSQNAFVGSVSERSDIVNLQQTSHPLLETISEESSVLKSGNLVSQGNQDYPPNLVFDPLYPEWYYDTITQMWCTLESYNHALHDASNASQVPLTNNANALAKVQDAFEGSISDISDVVNLQKTSHPVLETISEEGCVLSSRNQYPPNMVFDPQYPEWYYDTITNKWYTIESYNYAIHDASNITQDQLATNVSLDKAQDAFEGSLLDTPDAVNLRQTSQQALETITKESNVFNSSKQVPQDSIYYPPNMVFDPQYPEWYYDKITLMWYTLESYDHSLHDASDSYDKQKMWQPKLLTENGDVASSLNNQQMGSFYSSLEYTGSHPDKQLDPIHLEPMVKHNIGRSNRTVAQGYVTSESMHHVNKSNMEQSLQAYLSNSNYGTESSMHYSKQSFQGANPSYSQFSYNHNDGRSTAGRPPHALVTFGFGGRLLVMKDASFSSSSFVSGSQGTVGGVVSIHSLVDVVMTKADFWNTSAGCFGYFHTLCQESFPGPLVGGNAASKDINKWINDKISNSESSSAFFQDGLLLSDGPESAISKLFASVKRNDTSFGGGYSLHCMKSPPPEGNIRATASEVQNLLVSGRRKEALQRAQEGHLWGTAVVLAAQLGEQFYVDTVKQMALQQFVCGSPLRTLYLLIAGQPADVFSADSFSSGSSCAASGPYQSSEVIPNGLLDDWQENIAIIASNRTKDDELVIIHLGDCLWKERGEVAAAHACYLLAEVNFELYSDSARLCLIGADHWKNTRTYACPDSIQRTEIYEYTKVIGNSQFVLLPFQPYKLVYAYMLVEVGKVSDSLRYCQASMKMLKNSGRAPEVELWKALFASLEERLRTHQQGGYGTNLAPTKLVGKLFNSIDRSIHRMIGVPPLPPMLQNSSDSREINSLVQKVSSSQSAMAITSLVPSPSVEAISDWTGDDSKKVAHNRCISEPNFGRSTKRNSSKDGSSYGQGSASMSSGPSRFGRFGSQLLQKTIGWVSWSRHDHQAKLGESNKFYYDEKLKRWVEEGVELPTAEASLPPPPTAASFQNGKSHYDVKNALKSNNSHTTDPKQEIKVDAPSEQGFGLPSLPPSQNQFSACNRGGVRSRYVDTFNKAGGSFTSTFQSTSAPSVKPLSGANFFSPSAPTKHGDKTNDASTRASIHETTIIEEASTSADQESMFSQSSNPSSLSMPRFPSMDNITSSQSLPSGKSSLSRARASSWSGAYPDISNKAVGMEMHSFVVTGVASTFAPQNGTPHTQSSSSSSLHLVAGDSVLDDLHEVGLRCPSDVNATQCPAVYLCSLSFSGGWIFFGVVGDKCLHLHSLSLSLSLSLLFNIFFFIASLWLLQLRILAPPR